jgi:hypothetical protein
LVLGYLAIAGYEVLHGGNIAESVGKGGVAIRMPLGAYPFTRNGRTYFGKHPLQGFPDIFGVLKNRRGVMFAIELKSTNGRMGPNQSEWISRLKAAGVVAFVAKDLNTVVETLRREDVAA